MERQKVYVCIDIDGEVLSIYASKYEALRHMMDLFKDRYKMQLEYHKEIDWEDMMYDLESMIKYNYIEDAFYIEEHYIDEQYVPE